MAIKVTYNHSISLVEGVYCAQLNRRPPCLNGHYLNTFVYPILNKDGSPLTPKGLVELNPTDENKKCFNSGHDHLMFLPENVIAEVSCLAQWEEGEVPETTPPYKFGVVWDYQAKTLSVFAPYQVLLGINGLSLLESLAYLKDNLETVEEKIARAKKAWAKRGID